ncbi:NAD(P)-dependent oxidoreductase [Pseudoclavibacter chungangensis]|uniref:NAD(P)-dependent oxidoreductase n=1 Tax=Pseudoclavibacter chungangensis TaxID=587635 RepID=A0A7J5BMG7_9MICO|nr:NAD(P)-binding domain-containing protein [Pseudoclavibacter chungangensis]KAB1652611.1 NAD(P)-dependent oxidoreductase [Pseudoclavibacter chungangensis]NYJ68388.1 3-hydroxyisobutyrate dehydrogenase-like beta-hydroxyacid dehydrogenase [Pseudoclavibacter chungangensis]
MTERTNTITVLGLGPMGTAIAHAIAASGRPVAAWNRTPRTRTALGLTTDAIRLADDPVEAVEAAGIVVLCVRDHTAACEVIERIAPAVGQRIVVNAATGTPAEARASATAAERLGIAYVTAAIMVPTPLVGTDESLVLYAGADDELDALGPLLDALGGTADLTGTDHAVPPALDLAMLDVYFAGMDAHLHATALAAANGIEPARFLPYARGIVSTLGDSLAGLTDAVARRRYDGGQASLAMCRAFLEHIVGSSRDADIDPGIAGLVLDASRDAERDHPGTTDWDVVAERFLPTR